MMARHALADVASLVSEPTRAAMLLALLDGRALPAGELAAEARLSAAATSSHLAKLTSGGLLAVHREGRHRYYRLASRDVAHALEALGLIATAPAPSPRAVTADLSPEKRAFRAARSCYDHLAGALSVALAASLESRDLLRPTGERDYEVTPAGIGWFATSVGIDVPALARDRRVLARRCLDWSERRPHLAGSLGAAVLDRALERRWVVRISGSRALRVTERGTAELSGQGS